MSMQYYSTAPSRNLIRAEAQMLPYAESEQVLLTFGDQKAQPTRKTDTVVFRRLQPFNAGSNGVAQITATNFIAQEGVTPDANTISYVDISATVKQYVVLFKLTSKVELTYEDDIPGDMAELTGKTIGEIAELVAYGEFKAGISVLYANGSSRTAVNTAVTLNKLRAAARVLETNMGKKITKAIAPGVEFGTSGIEPAYAVFCHTDVVADFRGLTGFVPRVKYGSSMTPIHAREIGAVEDFRIVTSPLFRPFEGAGSSTTNGMLNNGTNVNVYPIMIQAMNAVGHVSLKGHGYKTGISPTFLPATHKTHANPAGMFGFVGADFWYAPVRLNENMMLRLEVGATSL